MATEAENLDRAHSNYRKWQEGDSLTGWLGDAIKTVLGTAKMPVDVAADALRGGVAGLVGGKLNDPAKFTSANYEDLNRNTNNVLRPFIDGGSAVVDAARSGMSGAGTALGKARATALGALDASPVEGVGTTPTAGGALPSPAGAGRGMIVPSAPPASVAAMPVARPGVRPASGPAAAPAAGTLPTPEMQPMMDMGSEPPNPQAAAPVAPAAIPPMPQSLKELFDAEMAKLPKKATADLTPEQRSRVQMNFWMNMLARSSKPGAYALGALGESGLAANAESTDQERHNLTASTADIQRQRDDVFKSIGFADKDRDNTRQDRNEVRQETRDAATAKRDEERIALLREQLNQGRWTQVSTNKGIMLRDAKTGKTMPMVGDDGKPMMPYQAPSQADHRSDAQKTVEFFTANPKALERWTEIQKAMGKGGDVTETTEFKAAMDLTKAQAGMGGDVDTGALLQKNLAAVKAAKGGAAAAGGPATPTTREEFNKLPSGTKFVNPADGQVLTKK